MQKKTIITSPGVYTPTPTFGYLFSIRILPHHNPKAYVAIMKKKTRPIASPVRSAYFKEDFVELAKALL